MDDEDEKILPVGINYCYTTGSYASQGSFTSREYSLALQASQKQPVIVEEPLNYADNFAILRHSKDKTKLLYACNGMIQAVNEGTLEGAKCEETVQLAYQLMINHPLDSQIVQAAFEIILSCNKKPEFRDSIDECEVYRPVIAAIKNHKQDPYFLGIAMETLASLALSALSCRGLRQSQAYLMVVEVLELYKYDVRVQTGGLLALSNLIQEDNFAQNNLVQRQKYKLISDSIGVHNSKPLLISNGYRALRQMCLPDRCRNILLQTTIYDQCVKLLNDYGHNVDVVSSCLGLLEALSIGESQEYLDEAHQINMFPLVHTSLHRHSESLDVCVYSLSIIDHLCADPSLLKGDIKIESILRFMFSAFQQHGESKDYQEAFTRCLARLLEVNSSLYMFVEDGSSGLEDEASQIRIPLLPWVWVVLLSSIHDIQHYKVYQSVSLAIYYLVVDCERLRRSFLQRDAATAVFEGLRQYINIDSTKFEKCVQYGCQALLSLLYCNAMNEKKNLIIQMAVVYDLIDILERFVTAPNVATEALSVIACLSDIDEFRTTACKQNIHTRILRLMRSNPTHSDMIESAIEVLIIFTELQPDMHTILNEGKVFKETINVLERNMSESISVKCLVLIHKLACEDYLIMNHQDARQLCLILSHFLADNEANTPNMSLIVEALVCISHLCRACPSLIPEILVDCETDLNLFNILFSREEQDSSGGDPSDQESAIFELAIDNIHSLKVNENCRQRMLLTAIQHNKIEAICLLIDIGADVNYSVEEDFSDSPIYQAVLSKDREIVEYLLSRNSNNRRHLKQALSLARAFELNDVVGLILKSLGLDRQRRFLNFGGLDLVEVKPSWIYPSLGLRYDTFSLHRHRRHKSLEYVTTLINKRNSVDNSSLASFSISNSIQSQQQNSLYSNNDPEKGIKNLLVAGGVAAMLPTFSDTERKSPLERFDERSINKSAPLPTRYKQRHSQGASRPPGLPTVISSPLATVKSNSMPLIVNNTNNISFDIEEDKIGLIGSMKQGESRDSIDGQEETGGGGERDEIDSDRDNDGEERVPERRHTKMLSKTGSTYVSFSTLAKYQRYSIDNEHGSNSITTLINENENDGDMTVPNQYYSLDAVRLAQTRQKLNNLGAKLVHRAARKSLFLKGKNNFISSKSSSSDDLASDGLSLSLTLKDTDLTTYLSESSTKQPEGKDLVDGSAIPPLVSPSPPPSLSVSNSYVDVPLRLKTLMYLDLSSNKMKDLESLVESNKKIIKSLKDVTTMDLKQNSLTELPLQLIEGLLALRKITLSQNIFTCFPHELNYALKLVEVDMSHNLISSFPVKAVCFPHLRIFNLSHNSLSVFPTCLNGEQFPSLRVLHLESNQICYIEEKDMKLKNLEELCLKKNSIKELPISFLVGMTSLKALDVSRNCLELLPGEAAEYMCKLQDLKLANNKLGHDEPQFQAFITTALVIQFVDASDNELTSFPPPYMWRSRGLKHLLLGNNKLLYIDLTDCERYWLSMERLVLSDNKLKEIPPDIGKLRTLSCLDISHNKDIRHLPNEIGKLDYLFYLNLKGIKNLDVDVNQNARATVRFLKSKLIQSKPCYTMKMMIVGEAGKGKTTLLNLLINEQHKTKNDNTVTLGVNIRKWRYEHRPGIKYTINCWDFAGQEEFYSTHQCFLTPRSIYVVVYNLLKGESEIESILSWLSNIQARAPDSEVIVVGTHKDMIPEELFISVKKTIQAQIIDVIRKPGFPKCVSFSEISLIGKKSGLDALKIKIKGRIDDATLRKQKIMGEMVPASYLDLCNMLEEESKQLSKNKSSGFRFIKRNQLLDMMTRVGLDKKMDKVELEQAVQFLHECGVLLHYDDIKSNLSDLYFLDPQWLCFIMSRVITIKQLTMISKGILKTQDIPLLLKGSQFPQELIPEYIRLLEWFDVALQYSPGRILIPSFLPKEKPGPISLPPDCKIIRRYSLCFIPPGFWPRLVTRLLSFPRKALQYQEPIKHMHWYSGVYSFWSLQAFFLIEQLRSSKTTFDITVPNTPQGIRLLCSVVDNIEVLIDEWFPGFRNVSIVQGDIMVAPFALCPHCPAYNAYLFPMAELVEESLKSDSIVCPVHKEAIPLKLLAPDIIIGDLHAKYHILYENLILDETNPASVIGKGGFGEVHKALYQGTTVAVKVFSSHSAEMHNTTVHQLVRQEVSILSQLRHPNIIKLVGIVRRPKAMLLLEYAELGSLNTFSPYTSISSSLKHRIATQVANGLAFLHKNNVIYRDLKPGNILIFSLSFNEKINAKLSDYGISTYATETGLREDIGTPGYKAPELLKAKTSRMPYDSKVDIYCYGLVMFQLISNGHAPFEELTPYERDKAVVEGRNIRTLSCYGGLPWPDMHDIIYHCLQYNPNDRPSAQQIFDRLCSPEFVSLRDVVPIHEGWEVLCFAIRNFRDKSIEHSQPSTEVWMASCDVTQRSMLSCVNLSKKQSVPQGRLLPYNNLILCMVSVGSSMVLFGTNSGDIIVCDGFDEKKEHKLGKLTDSILCLNFVRARSDNKRYVFAGLANGTLIAFDQCVLQTPDARPDSIIELNDGPVRGIKRLHGLLYVISGLEVFVINLSTLMITRQWEACDDPTRRFLTCIEADDDTVWTAAHNSPLMKVWDPKDASLIKTINTQESLKTIYNNGSSQNSSSSFHSFQDSIMFRITAMHLKVSAPSLMWVGLATGHIIMYDVTTFIPLMATRRHENPVRAMQTVKTTTDDKVTNVVLSCGLGFKARPGHCVDSNTNESLDNFGILLLWDCSMPHMKNSFDEITKEQAPYR